MCLQKEPLISSVSMNSKHHHIKATGQNLQHVTLLGVSDACILMHTVDPFASPTSLQDIRVMLGLVVETIRHPMKFCQSQ